MYVNDFILDYDSLFFNKIYDELNTIKLVFFGYVKRYQPDLWMS